MPVSINDRNATEKDPRGANKMTGLGRALSLSLLGPFSSDRRKSEQLETETAAKQTLISAARISLSGAD